MNKLDEFNAAAPAPKAAGNTVMDIPEREFRMAWIAMLSQAMLRSGRGFRVDTPKRRQPKGAAMWRGARRADKVGTSKTQRALQAVWR